MFVQIHMLQSMPPGNLNRDKEGHPKQCVFGGVTRGRISSQCLKRNIRHSSQFKEAFGDALGCRTMYLPRMVADELKKDQKLGVPENELNDLMLAIANKFKKDKAKDSAETEDSEGEGNDEGEAPDKSSEVSEIGQTAQLVYFREPFARSIAELASAFRRERPLAYGYLLTGVAPPETEEEKAKFKSKKDELKKAKSELKKEEKTADTDEEKAAIKDKKAALAKEEETIKAEAEKKKETLKAEIEAFVKRIATASKTLTVDIGLFGRMTTSDLVVDVEAACQVAHAISTHETLIESDYFTAMDDRSDKAGAAFMGTETFFNSAVYYKYLNLDVDALQKHLSHLSAEEVAHAAGVLVCAAALANPTGKQNSFAAHGVPEVILIEVSKTKRPLSYANAFLQPVKGDNLMTESAKGLATYIDAVAAAYAPTDVRRVLLAVGNASPAALKSTHDSAPTLDELAQKVVELIAPSQKGGATA